MKTRYHVASPEYVPGEDLYCAARLMDMGYSVASKWDGDLVDTDVVCLFDTLAEAEAFRAEYQPDGLILSIMLDEDDPELRLTRVEEGYAAVFGSIPADYITIV